MPELTQKQFISDVASATSKQYAWCMRISHESIDTVRLVNQLANLEREDGTYLRFPFSPVPPEQTDQRPPEFEIDVDIVDQRIMKAIRPLRGLRAGALITMFRVWVEEPDNIIWGPAGYRFERFTTDTIAKGTLYGSYLKGAMDDAYPVGRISPASAGA